MGFFKNLLGLNQKRSTGSVRAEMKNAYEPSTTFNTDMMQYGKDIMNPFSQENTNQKAISDAGALDSAYTTAQIANRMPGAQNLPAGVASANLEANINKNLGAANESFLNYLVGQKDKGINIQSGATKNLTTANLDINNAVNMQRARNNQIDSQAAGAIANVAGGLLEKANPFGFFSQIGGEVPDEDEMYMMYGGKVKYQQGGPADFKPHMMYKGDEEEMANTFADHLRLKKAGYSHKKEMAEGGFLSRILGGKSGKEQMPSQEELDAMKPYADRYHDMRENYHDQDSRPDLLPMPIAQDYEPHRTRGDDESYIPAQDTRLLKDGSLYNKAEEEWEQLKAQARKGIIDPPPVSKQHGGMVSQIMGPKGPMRIPTRMGGQKIGG